MIDGITREHVVQFGLVLFGALAKVAEWLIKRKSESAASSWRVERLELQMAVQRLQHENERLTAELAVSQSEVLRLQGFIGGGEA